MFRESLHEAASPAACLLWTCRTASGSEQNRGRPVRTSVTGQPITGRHLLTGSDTGESDSFHTWLIPAQAHNSNQDQNRNENQENQRKHNNSNSDEGRRERGGGLRRSWRRNQENLVSSRLSRFLGPYYGWILETDTSEHERVTWGTNSLHVWRPFVHQDGPNLPFGSATVMVVWSLLCPELVSHQ